MICSNCNSSNTATDSVQGVVYCTNCGMVQEENIIVNTINFTDNGTKSTLNGKIINIDSKHVGTQYVDASFYIKNTISSICSNMGLGNNFLECSYRYYRLLLPYNLSKGKSILYTLSACIYIVCREEKTPHLLIDFSNALNIDVFKIGKSFNKIVEVLNLNIPNVDPTLYIQRYIIKLNLKNPKITSLALRIISRMNRDWITTGRRPNNICGVAILIASRVYNEERSIIEIAKVVHVSETILRKRLMEIGDTESAQLSLNEFNSEWKIKEEDPPVLKNESKKNFKKIENFSDNKIFEDNSEEDLLNEEEVAEREKMWEEMYGSFMIEKEEKLKHIKKPKRKNNKKQYNNVSDVLKSLNKRVSSKINYSVIENLFDDL
ncbi:transcription factor IIIB 70 kDa subunit (BRF1) [Vairimorpha necatrix]|uniref:Transcription factor IIIB 70 kDa subunit (BRF1) n=1 Tax=Vairimorpha necatrix TaxID=6039 RepID=A0AAX4JC12_9MICR